MEKFVKVIRTLEEFKSEFPEFNETEVYKYDENPIFSDAFENWCAEIDEDDDEEYTEENVTCFIKGNVDPLEIYQELGFEPAIKPNQRFKIEDFEKIVRKYEDNFCSYNFWEILSELPKEDKGYKFVAVDLLSHYSGKNGSSYIADNKEVLINLEKLFYVLYTLPEEAIADMLEDK